ncbi:hypothetical protein SAMN05421788_102565 [Filimonas lacunae]|uniref:Uncharacterized protein n=1 Tax=Filimonas lacunae TaxID=477680 RepID=A0A173MH29_9BACT|nr:hypothetical protein [Filimonas lacunae]BAV06799.1 hypothetical protein FLA_2819 [Filimonas lacunae]SIS99581.1 hypothetical protein SAMN05421788_102565 [Filimonas lacunae]
MSLPLRYERFLLLAMQAIDNQATEAEQEELTQLLLQYPELEAGFSRIQQTYHFRSPVRAVPNAAAAFERHLHKLQSHIHPSRALNLPQLTWQYNTKWSEPDNNKNTTGNDRNRKPNR